MTASIADGVLTIHVPMPEARKPHRIKIADRSHAAIKSGPEYEELEAAASGSSDVQEPALAGAAACSEGLVRCGETPIDHSIAGHTEFIQYLRQVSEQAVAKV